MNTSKEHPKTGRLPDEAVELIAAELRVVAEPERIRLLENLSRTDATTEELAEQSGISQETISEHLEVLFDVGLLARKGEGISARYGLIDTTGWWVIEQIGKAIAARIEAQRHHEINRTRSRHDG